MYFITASSISFLKTKLKDYFSSTMEQMLKIGL